MKKYLIVLLVVILISIVARAIYLKLNNSPEDQAVFNRVILRGTKGGYYFSSREGESIYLSTKVAGQYNDFLAENFDKELNIEGWVTEYPCPKNEDKMTQCFNGKMLSQLDRVSLSAESFPVQSTAHQYSCQADNDCHLSCIWGAVNEAWYVNNGQEENCVGGCNGIGMKVHCVNNVCHTFLVNDKPADFYCSGRDKKFNLSGQISCAKENEAIGAMEMPNQCCIGLLPMVGGYNETNCSLPPAPTGLSVCSNCGDGVCNQGVENKCNCPADCGNEKKKCEDYENVCGEALFEQQQKSGDIYDPDKKCWFKCVTPGT
ncbi:MAG: hypothetical protein WC531_00270 [Candidatus Paceibacterota bacterium]|jgi:hypothetical protein